MSTFIHTIVQVFIMTQGAVGMVANAFIVAVGYTDWVKRKKLPTCDMILICLSTSRLLLQGTILHSALFPEIGQWNVLRVHSVLLVLASTACLWFAACLSTFYCVKIATFTQRCFLIIKLRVPRMVPQLLLGSVLVSLISSLPFIWVDYSTYLCNSTRSLLRNATFESPFGNVSYFKCFFMYLTWTIIPLLFFLVSSTLLIASLWRHTKEMRHGVMGFKDPRTEAHITAIKCLISFLICYICTFVAEILLGIPSCRARNKWKYNICMLVVALSSAM
ncbi:taste receptor type 2 member 40-like [Rhineura floridana]|uniref:taste receptor type 2 member 40-like n=1 Tax=Rhineura floridana TaxID=261503 RepID=UPI002AC7F5B3|nr:taste receptor type 2 member 40-like [Rhineura floridana]